MNSYITSNVLMYIVQKGERA